MNRADGWPGLRSAYALGHVDVRGLDHDGRYYFIGATEHRYPEKLKGISLNISLDTGLYVFDPETSTVRKTAVEGKGMIGDQGIITKGIAPGDVVVVAGVPFLRDGQEVKLMNPSQAAQ